MRNVLDHGSIQLVDHMGNDLSVVRSARVSYDADWRTGEDAGKDEKLLRYLMKNKHTSPFESVTFSFAVRLPIFAARQWMRHRTLSYNEVSARYTELPDDFYVPEVQHITGQSETNKQMRTDAVHPQAGYIQDCIRNHCLAAFSAYKAMLAAGAPRELARGVLPVNAYTRMTCTGNLLNFFRFCNLRRHEHAQHEIRVYADAMLDLIEEHCPISVQAFKEYGL